MKLPALTRAEIAALPDGWYSRPNGSPIVVLGGRLAFATAKVPEMLSQQTILASLIRNGGITARLVDAAPLEALLRGIVKLAEEDFATTPDQDWRIQVTHQATDRLQEICARIEAALNPEQSDECTEVG